MKRLGSAVAAVVAAPLLFLFIRGAAASLQPHPDSLRWMLAIIATVPLVGAAGLLAVTAAEIAQVTSAWKHRARYALFVYGVAVLMLAAPLLTTATDDPEASTGVPPFALTCVGVIGVGLILTTVMLRRREYGIVAVVALGTVLVAVGIARDLSAA